MPTGYSLHIGVTNPDSRYVSGRLPPAFGCDLAARRMCEEVAQVMGFQPNDGCRNAVLVNDEATGEAVHERLADIASNLRDGDIFFFSFAGHGVRIDNAPGIGEDARTKGHNQGFCLRNKLWIDDEFYEYLASIKCKARVIFVAQACFSGSLATVSASHVQLESIRTRGQALSALDTTEIRQWLASPQGWRFDVLSQPRTPRGPLSVDALLLAACQDDQVTIGAASAKELPPFTSALLENWRASQSYAELCTIISERLERRSISKAVLNCKLASQRFVHQKPFTL